MLLFCQYVHCFCFSNTREEKNPNSFHLGSEPQILLSIHDLRLQIKAEI